MSEGSNFWSRRREGVAAEAEAEQSAVEAQALAEEHAVLEEKTDDEILAELKLPDPESLKMGDDFKVFMAKAVPDRIRRRALRTLWRSNPVLANLDSMVDYGQDFTDAAMCVENLQTTYQVGKGMLKHVEEMARQAEARENPPQIEPEVEPELEDDATEPDAELQMAEDLPDAGPEPIEVADTQDAEPAFAPMPRRMKFTTQETAA